MELTLSTQCSPSDPPFSLQGAALAHLDSLPPHDLVIWTYGSIPFLFSKNHLTSLPIALVVSLRSFFPIRHTQCVEAFLLKPTSFCNLSAGIGRTNKIATSLPLFRISLCPCYTLLSSPPSFILSHSHICQVLSFLFSSFSAWLQWVPDLLLHLGNDTVDESTRRGALLQPSTVPCSLYSLTTRILSSLHLD